MLACTFSVNLGDISLAGCSIRASLQVAPSPVFSSVASDMFVLSTAAVKSTDESITSFLVLSY